MKIAFKSLLVAAALILCGQAVSAQTPKFGIVNLEEIITAMPERDSAAAKLTKIEADLNGQIEAIMVEFNNKLQEYQKGAETMSTAVKQIKEKELQDLQRRREEFTQAAQQDYSEEQAKLMGPVFEKAEAAIKKVSKAQGLTLVFDQGGLVYYDEATVVNVVPLVKKELGIQ